MIKNFGQEISKFVVGIDFDDLPKTVRQEVKWMLMDNIGCALAGGECDKGRISVELARRLGGTPESSIIGVSEKVSTCNAAFANGELINSLDYSSITGGHTPGEVIPSTLALAESVGASGKDLITATAVGFEVACRVNRAITPLKTDMAPKKAEEIGLNGVILNKYQDDWWRTLVKGQSMFLFGGAAGAGKILKLDYEKMIHALGIAGHLCPIATNRKWNTTKPPGAMTKYGHSGFPSMAAVKSVLLAQMGYLGDTTVFDGEYGFWRMYGAGKWEPEDALEKIGEEWLVMMGTYYKPYPCCIGIHGALASFISVIEKNGLTPEEIESIKAYVDPVVVHWVLGEGLASHIDAQFNVPYCFACAAYRIPIGADWQTPDTMRNPKILELMKKVSKEPAPDCRGKEGKEWRADRFINSGAVEVMARGEIFGEARIIYRDDAFKDPWMTEEEIVDKFRHNASAILTNKKVDQAIEYLLKLEELENVQELIAQITP